MMTSKSIWLFSALLALCLCHPAQARADCVLWDLSGHWEFWQSNKAKASFNLVQDSTGKIGGKGHYSQETDTKFGTADEGTVTGLMTGNRFNFVVTWGASRGEYKGEVGPQGELTGITQDLARPQVVASWHEWRGRRAKCMTAQTPPSKRVDPNFQENTDMPGNDLRGFETKKGAEAECSVACSDDPQCKAWTWVKPGIQSAKGKCWINNAVPIAVADKCCISGVRGKVIRAQGKTPEPAPGKVIKARGPARAVDDVEIFDHPVEPRRAVGMMPAGAKGRAIEHHSHGWCRLENIEKSVPAGIVTGWIPDDHLVDGKCPVP